MALNGSSKRAEVRPSRTEFYFFAKSDLGDYPTQGAIFMDGDSLKLSKVGDAARASDAELVWLP